MAKTTVEFGRKASKELERLTDLLRTDKCTVIRFALSLYSYVVKELAGTNKNLALMRNDSVEKIIAVPGLRK